MTIVFKERSSDSPFIETITHGWTASAGCTVRPAESRWHMVLRKLGSDVRLLVVAPLTTAGEIRYGEGAELVWIKFRLGVYMPHFAFKNYLDLETVLPDASSGSFWLKGSAWQLPDWDNIETFVDRLARQELLASDPVVEAVLQGRRLTAAPRTVRHRFLHTTGLTYTHIKQVERARQAERLLRQGVSILEAVYDLGYTDQPHLTRALKHFIGYTPAQITHTPHIEGVVT